MSGRFRNVALTKRGGRMLNDASPDEPQFHREYAENTQQYIDEEMAQVIAARYALVLEKLRENRPLLDEISSLLLEKEVLDEKEFKAILNRK
jgi:cell division protease FtsH